MNRIGRRLRREWVSRRLKRHLDKEPLELTRLGTDHADGFCLLKRWTLEEWQSALERAKTSVLTWN